MSSSPKADFRPCTMPHFLSALTKFFLWILITFLAQTLSAQGTYPLHTGNYWRFHDTYADQFAHSWKAVGDTVFPNGKRYQRLVEFPATYYSLYLRQEGSKVYQYFAYPDSAYEWLRYDFSKGPGDTVAVIPIANNGTSIIRVSSRGLVQYFGRTLTRWTFSESWGGNGSLESVVDSLGTTYELYEGGESVYLRGAIIDGVTYGLIDAVEEKEGASVASTQNFTLWQNYPNPFNASTTISFLLNTDQHVMLRIYDMLGREVRQVLDERLPRGSHTVRWDGKDNLNSNVSSGFYVYRLMGDGFASSKAMILLK